MEDLRRIFITNTRNTVKNTIFAAAAATGVFMYEKMPFDQAHNSAGIITSIVMVICFLVYNFLSTVGFSKKSIFCWSVFAMTFSAVTVIGAYLDKGTGFTAVGIASLNWRLYEAFVQYSKPLIILEIILFYFAIIPAILTIVYCLNLLGENESENQKKDQRAETAAFGTIIAVWGLTYLAAFPGIYAIDAPTWYLEFSNPNIPVSSQWSPVYSGLFYMFVSVGEKISGSYVAGLAVFIAVQMSFILMVIKTIIGYMDDRFGRKGVILTTLFYTLLPTHAILSASTAQGAVGMSCVAVAMIHISRMIESPKEYWNNIRNAVLFIIWVVIACMFRNNIYYAVILFLPFILLYKKNYRRKLFVTVVVALIVVTIYKGPVLDAFGVQKGTAIREMLSLPLQQIACAYEDYQDSLTSSQKKMIRKYIPAESLSHYDEQSGISDTVKRNFKINTFKQNPREFIGLYFNVGKTVPAAYIKATYLQNLGLFYIDKAYPDYRIWHPYINYTSYIVKAPGYINIPKRSLLPTYDKVLSVLFDYDIPQRGWGDVPMFFSMVPILSTLCRASTYFWIVFFLAIYGIYRKNRNVVFLLGLPIGLTLTVFLAPLICYRYMAPVIFSMPILVGAIFINSKSHFSAAKNSFNGVERYEK